MAIQQEIGNKGENIASDYLINSGFKIVERNFRLGKSEIDIIGIEEKVLVFVEVKTRTSSMYGNPEDFVNEAKAAKIIEGAEGYINQINWSGPIRFDIVSVKINAKTIEVKHFKDAFY